MNTTKKSVWLAVSAVAFVILGADAWAADATKEVAALHAVDQVWLISYNSGDADKAAAQYDENAILMPPGTPAAHGRAAIRASLAADMAESKKAGVVFHLGPTPDGGVQGNMGWVSGTYSITDASGHVVDTGKYLSVSKKEGGKWLYVRDTWNSDGAAPKQ